MQDDAVKSNHANVRNKIRRLFREHRNKLSIPQRETAARSLLNVLQEHRIFDSGANSSVSIALYKTHDAELSTEPLISHCWQSGIDVYLPVLHPFTQGHLLFLKYTKDTAMTQNIYGIFEPKLDVTAVCPANRLNVIFTPLVAFDISGNRLGMGGGFYDRTLSALNKNKDNPKVIGLAYEMQRLDELPVASWDIPLPQIATPSKLYSF